MAKQFINEALAKHQGLGRQLTIHADRGRVIKSRPVAFLMADLGVAESHGRLDVSDDNPYFESQFRTIKYRLDFPDRFGLHPRQPPFASTFSNGTTKSTATPASPYSPTAMVHFGETQTVLAHRQVVLDAAYQAHPDRFVRRPPKPMPLPSEVWINKPVPSGEKTDTRLGLEWVHRNPVASNDPNNLSGRVLSTHLLGDSEG